MTRHTGGALLSTLKVDRHSRMPLYRQLEEIIRKAIQRGDISTGQRLPASRQLASDLGISRLTVKNVYEQLVTENYLVSRPGAGTYVAEIGSSELLPTTKQAVLPGSQALPLSGA